jgi:hypothetical protein
METHPEEFYQDKKSGVKFNWSHQIKDNKKFMTEDEYKAVWSKYSEINLERSMQEITERLLAPSDEVELHGFGNAPIKAQGDAVAYMKQQQIRMEQQHDLLRKQADIDLMKTLFKEYR